MEEYMKTLRYVLSVILITFVLSASAFAQPISQVVVLGDSLSDNGNLYYFTSTFLHFPWPPDPPYWQGRASNGPVAVEYFAQSLGIPLKDFAWYAATTGVGNFMDNGSVDTFGFASLPGITTVLNAALSAGAFPIDPNALYIVWGGANDMWNLTPATYLPAIDKAVTNLVAIVATLKSKGAKQILVPNMPDLGKIPMILLKGSAASGFFTQVSLAFDELLRAGMLPLNAHNFDMFSLTSNVISNPGKYGFVNVTDPCLAGMSPCANPDEYAFFDGAHPTTAFHEIIADTLYQSAAPTVTISGCDSGVPNELFSTGSTISDLIIQAGYGAKNHGQFVSTVASIINQLKKSGAISESQKGAIQSCAAKARIP
jgi:cholinesterase